MADQYSIAAGWNATGSLVLITNIVVSTKYFSPVQGLGMYDEGEARFKLGGLIDDVGYAQFEWFSTMLPTIHYAYLYTTLLSGARSGKVTARTRLNDGSWVNRNAYLTLKKRPGESRVLETYTDLVWSFTRAHSTS
jgi:hypothetical protein